jgi:hypothetical protein
MMSKVISKGPEFLLRITFVKSFNFVIVKPPYREQDRFTKEVVTKYPVASVVPIEHMVKKYYRIREYDPRTAGPSFEELKHLGIEV